MYNKLFKKLRIPLAVSLTGIILISALSSKVCNADTRSDYNEANEKLEELRQEQQMLSSELTNLTTTLEAVGAQIAEIEEKISDKQEEIDELQDQIDSLNADIKKQYSDMKLRIQYMYENGDKQIISALLTSDNISDFLLKSQYIQAISSYDRKMQQQLNDSFTTLTYCKTVLDEDMDNLLALKEQSTSKQDLLQRKVSEFLSNIDTNNENILAAEALAKEYENKLKAENTSSGGDSTGAAIMLDSWTSTPYNYTADELAMMAAIIECEAGDQSYECLIAVGSVIMNRVECPYWGTTISSVLYSPGQFTPVASGTFAITLARGAMSSCQAAAKEVLEGRRNINALYFHTYRPATDSGGILIGNMYFK